MGKFLVNSPISVKSPHLNVYLTETALGSQQPHNQATRDYINLHRACFFQIHYQSRLLDDSVRYMMDNTCLWSLPVENCHLLKRNGPYKIKSVWQLFIASISGAITSWGVIFMTVLTTKVWVSYIQMVYQKATGYSDAQSILIYSGICSNISKSARGLYIPWSWIYCLVALVLPSYLR